MAIQEDTEEVINGITTVVGETMEEIRTTETEMVEDIKETTEETTMVDIKITSMEDIAVAEVMVMVQDFKGVAEAEGVEEETEIMDRLIRPNA